MIPYQSELSDFPCPNPDHIHHLHLENPYLENLHLEPGRLDGSPL
jgi:hypothetical protein